MNIKPFNYNSQEYEAELKLRNEVLRIPLGMCLYDEDVSRDAYDIHIGAFIDDNLIGVLILTQLKNSIVQMRQLAVTESLRGKNIGKDLVIYFEDYARKLGAKKIILHARENVIGFYEKLGYTKFGERFTEVTIPHFEMEKIIHF